jgi:hypothetical protein
MARSVSIDILLVRLNSNRLSQLCTRRILWYCGPPLAGVCVLLLVTRGELTFTTDSVFYWSAAHTLLQRHELATGIAYDGSTLQAALSHGRLPPPFDPFTAFAPGYAVVLAAVAWCTAATVTQAALLVNVLSVVAIILLVAWLGRRASGGAVGFVAATMIGLLPFFPGTVREALSEAQFTALVLSALAFVVLWFEKPEKRVASLYVACFLGAVATYTRYIGVSFFILAVATTVYRLLAVRRSRPVLHAVAALGTYILLMIPLAVRNVTLSGYLGGAFRPPSEKGLLANLADLARGLFDALPLVRTVAVGPLDVIISASLLAVVTIGSLDWKTLRTRPLLSCSREFRCACCFQLSSQRSFWRSPLAGSRYGPIAEQRWRWCG